jgi:hypothetical protein
MSRKLHFISLVLLFILVLVPATHAQTSPDVTGTVGDVIVNGVEGNFTATGIMLRAKSTRPYVIAQTGTADRNSAFSVFNSANAELLRVRGDGLVTLGGFGGSEWGPALGRSIEQGSSSINFGDIGEVMMTSNAYWASSNGWKFRNPNGKAANYFLYDGRHRWRVTRPLVPAGPDIVWTEPMTIREDGSVIIGHPESDPFVPETGRAYLLRVTSPSSNGFGLRIRDAQSYGGAGFGVVMDLDGNSEIRVSNNLVLGREGRPVIAALNNDLEVNPTGGRNVIIGSAGAPSNLIVNGEVRGAKVLGAVYQDVAEWVRSEEPLTDATVVVVAPEADDEVVASTRAYDTRVAGVVSPNPGVLLGVGGEGKYKIATTGRVKVKVDASTHPIARGDLLVSSSTPGVAMKSVPVEVGGVAMHRPGTLIGKALEPLASGQGEILVLLSLQ